MLPRNGHDAESLSRAFFVLKQRALWRDVGQPDAGCVCALRSYCQATVGLHRWEEAAESLLAAARRGEVSVSVIYGVDVFITGASGPFGHVTAPLLVHSGHPVCGLAHSGSTVEAICAMRTEPVGGNLFDVASLGSACSYVYREGIPGEDDDDLTPPTPAWG